MVIKKLGLDPDPDSGFTKTPGSGSLSNKKDRPTPEILCLVSERVGGDPVRKRDDAVGEVMHGQPGDDLAQLHARSSCAPAHHTSIKDTRALVYSDFNNLMGFTSKKMPNNIL
jgi:hypothetical protein